MFSLLVLLPNLIWPWIARIIFRTTINLWETVINVVVVLVVAISIVEYSKWSSVSDHQVFNGSVLDKERRKVSCSHSYPCNPYTVCSGSGSSRTCTTKWRTCYRHPYDISWIVKTDIGEFKISRIDSRGLREPPRYTEVKIGDYVSSISDYDNYVLAAPTSLFNFSETIDFKVPDYPDKIYDYYKLDRVISDNSQINTRVWSTRLSELLSKLGPKKKVNVILVVTEKSSPAFAEAIRSAWKGGKKNDVVIVMHQELKWVNVFSWSKNELFKIQIRDDLLKLQSLDLDSILQIIENRISEGYEVSTETDFEYLKHEMKPTTFALVSAFITCLLINIVLTWYFHSNEFNPMRKNK